MAKNEPNTKGLYKSKTQKRSLLAILSSMNRSTSSFCTKVIEFFDLVGDDDDCPRGGHLMRT